MDFRSKPELHSVGRAGRHSDVHGHTGEDMRLGVYGYGLMGRNGSSQLVGVFICLLLSISFDPIWE